MIILVFRMIELLHILGMIFFNKINKIFIKFKCIYMNLIANYLAFNDGSFIFYLFINIIFLN